MRKLLFAICFSACLLAVLPPYVHAFTGCSENCEICHSLTKSEAEHICSDLLKTRIMVTDVSNSPVRGLWSVSYVFSDGSKGSFLLDYGKKHILMGAEIIPNSAAGGNLKGHPVINNINNFLKLN